MQKSQGTFGKFSVLESRLYMPAVLVFSLDHDLNDKWGNTHHLTVGRGSPSTTTSNLASWPSGTVADSGRFKNSGWRSAVTKQPQHCCRRAEGVFTAHVMLLIAVSYRRCGRNLRATFDTVINSLSANHAYLKTA